MLDDRPSMAETPLPVSQPSMVASSRLPVHRPTWLEIDLDAIRNNVRLLRQLVGPERTLFAVVKANAYGHGATLVAPAALAAGADQLAVAAVNEGIELRNAGINAPILVMGYVPGWQAPALLDYRLTAAIYDMEVAQIFSHVAEGTGGTISVHVKVDTGMHRLGLYPDAGPSFLQALSLLPGLQIEGIYTHFSSADEVDQGFTQRQLAQFTALVDTLQGMKLCPAVIHCANSAATLSLPAAHLNGVRSGISLYGLHPSPESRLPEGFRPALRWVAHVAQVKTLQPGDTVSYGNTYTAERPRAIAVLPVGYADGFPRSPRTWGNVIVAGHLAPIRGRVCMDQTIVDVTEVFAAGGKVQPGDEAVLIGQQRELTLSAEAIAERLETINYEVVSRLMARLPRIPKGVSCSW